VRFLILFLAFSFGAHAAAAELLPPEQAFKFSARVAGPAIEVTYDIAPGYYMYRDKFKFELMPSTVAGGEPRLPPGKVHEDEFFGKVETYRDAVTLRVPVAPGAKGEAVLSATSQGCADAGVCYLPNTQKAVLLLAGAGAPSAGEAQQEFLPPEQAFKVDVQAVDSSTLRARFTPAEGYYFYRDKTEFSLAPPAPTQIKQTTLPPGELKSDPTFGDVHVFHQPFEAIISLASPAEKVKLRAVYQGCAEAGLCYPPITKVFDVSLPGAPFNASARGTDGSTGVSHLLSANFALLTGGFFVIGLALAFTPCVLPMIPILSGIIAGQGPGLTTRRAFALSAAYVLGMALTYALAGIAAALSGSMLAAAMQNPWVLSTFALIFVLLALSMFGFYELQIPPSWQSGLSQASSRLQRGKLAGVFAMGVLSAIIVSPCVTAPLVGALMFISQSGDIARGGSALFAMALGMGSPLLLIGTSAGALLPKTGAWMEGVKKFFGVLLLGVAIWIISPVIPAVAHMLAWAALLIMSAVYLRALDPLPQPASGVAMFGKGVGVLALLAGVALIVGALSGGRDVLQPLAGLRGGSQAEETSHLDFERVKTVSELDARLADARGRYVMLDFYADWCVACKEMERFTFSDPRVRARLKDTLLLQADVTANSTQDAALLKRFGLFGPPGIIFFDREGRETARVIGFEPVERFLRSLDRATAGGKEI
jgi:thiol:disulfide interchange protein DsbD